MVARFLTRLIDGQRVWAKPLGDFNRRWLSWIIDRTGSIKDFLHGRWLGHPLHSATTDIPIGALTVAIVLDVLNLRAAADVSLVIGILFMVLSAFSGAADYTDTDGTALLRATVHSTLMVLALILFVVSLALRSSDPADRAVPIVLSVAAYAVLLAGAYVGGDVAYVLGTMVNRHAFRAGKRDWAAIEIEGGELPDGVPVRAGAGATTLVLVRLGATIHAMDGRCAHAGGPLFEGPLVDGCIECPWHGSRFRVETGHVRRGPAVYDQPAYEVRQTEGGRWEARRRP